jgi:membrane protein DedA with SNARE-associated domain
MEAQFIINQLGTFSYWGIFGISFLANVVLPVPEEITLLALGYLAGTGHISIYYTIPIVIVGLLASDIVMYSLARAGNKFVGGIYNKFFAHRIETKQEWFEAHIEKVIFYSRFMVQLRFIGPFLAGHLKVPFRKFITYELAALVLYVPLFIWSGKYFHSRIVRVIDGVGILRNVILITLGIIVAISLLLNGLIAVLDILAGFFFALQPSITPYLIGFSEHTGAISTLAGLILTMSDRVQTIGAFYFFSHGAVKFLLVWGLWKSKLWAYPVSIVFLTGFSLYQLYEIIIHYSFIVTAFLLFNTIVIILVIQEYRRVVAMTKLTLNKPI